MKHWYTNQPFLVVRIGLPSRPWQPGQGMECNNRNPQVTRYTVGSVLVVDRISGICGTCACADAMLCESCRASARSTQFLRALTYAATGWFLGFLLQVLLSTLAADVY